MLSMINKTPSRRSVLQWGLSAAAGTLGASRLLGEEPSTAPAGDRAYAFGLEPVGEIAPVSSSSIEASPLSVGFEVLDRKGFEPSKAYPHLAKLGVKWARCQTGWCRCETVPGELTFDWLDEVVDTLRRIGIQPWFNLGYGNRLYTPESADPAAVGWVPIFDEAARRAWVRFVGRIAAHFKDRVKHWEIWNEPKSTSFWKPRKSDPKDYVELVKLTVPEIRRAVPGAVIVGGAFAGIPMPYIKACLEAGLAGHVDKISYHPYRAVPELKYEEEIEALRKMIAEHRPGIEIWQGENGCPSMGGPETVGALSQLEWNETRQAKWLLRRILIDLSLGIELTSYYHTADLIGYRGKNNMKGLLRGHDYSPKPSYRAYQCVCALFDSRTSLAKWKPEVTSCGIAADKRPFVRSAGFVRAGAPIVAFWYPADLQKGWSPARIALQLPVEAGRAMNRPVLIDTLTGRAYALGHRENLPQGHTFKDLPLLDYPLLLTDASLVGEAKGRQGAIYGSEYHVVHITDSGWARSSPRSPTIRAAASLSDGRSARGPV